MGFLKILGKIFAVLLCIVYFFGLTALMTVSFSTNLLSEKYYGTILKDLDLNSIKVSDLGEVFDGANLDEDASVEDALIAYLTRGGIEEKVAISIIDNDEIREIVGKFIAGFMNYNLGGDAPKISREDVKTVLTNPDVVAVLGQNPTDADIDKIYNQLNDATKKLVEDGGARNDNFEKISNNYINN